MPWRGRPSVGPTSIVRRPSVKRVFSETVEQINAKFCGKVAIHHISRPFLALLDYVSRAHEIAICLSSVRPSVRCPSVRVAIISELNARISFKF